MYTAFQIEKFDGNQWNPLFKRSGISDYDVGPMIKSLQQRWVVLVHELRILPLFGTKEEAFETLSLVRGQYKKEERDLFRVSEVDWYLETPGDFPCETFEEAAEVVAHHIVENYPQQLQSQIKKVNISPSGALCDVTVGFFVEERDLRWYGVTSPLLRQELAHQSQLRMINEITTLIEEARPGGADLILDHIRNGGSL